MQEQSVPDSTFVLFLFYFVSLFEGEIEWDGSVWI